MVKKLIKKWVKVVDKKPYVGQKKFRQSTKKMVKKGDQKWVKVVDKKTYVGEIKFGQSTKTIYGQKGN